MKELEASPLHPTHRPQSTVFICFAFSHCITGLAILYEAFPAQLGTEI